MKNHFVAAAAFAALAFGGAQASAGVISVTSLSGSGLPAGFSLITDFNSTNGGGVFHSNGVTPDGSGGVVTDLAPHFGLTIENGAYTRLAGPGLDSGWSAPPPTLAADEWYATVVNGSKITLTSDKGLRFFSFFMGSPDTYNHVKFTFYGAGGVETLDGTDIWGGSPPGNGDQSFGTTVVYEFGPEPVYKIELTSTGNSFEFDKFAGVAVPEPGAWALMMLGVGLAGGALRSNRRKALAAA